MRFTTAAVALCALACASAGVHGEPKGRPPVPPLNVEQFGSGPPLLALHGFGGSIYSWNAIRSELSAHHTVYAIDLKGFGGSPKPRDGHYSVHDQASLILQFIADRHLTGVTLVGHSFGGGVSLVVATELAEKQPGVLSKLVLFDAASFRQDLPWFISILKTPLFGAVSQHLMTSRAQVHKVLNYAFFNDRLVSAAAIEAYSAPLRQPGGKYAIRETAAQIVPKDIDVISSRYPSINVPTLLFWGRQDRIIPLAMGERLQRTIPGARLIVIDRCGHIPQEECPDGVRQPLADFLRAGQEGGR